MRVIFLDIDGVLYPCHKRRSPMACKQSDTQQLARQYHCPAILTLSEFDLDAIQYGWDPMAMRYLTLLTEQCEAMIVISSSWKFSRSLEQLKALFAFYGLQDRVIDKTGDAYGFLKTLAIRGYLKDHPEIDSYVVLDDLFMERDFPQHMVTCPDVLDKESYEKALRILR